MVLSFRTQRSVADGLKISCKSHEVGGFFGNTKGHVVCPSLNLLKLCLFCKARLRHHQVPRSPILRANFMLPFASCP